MLMRMFSAYDVKTMIYFPPSFCHNEYDARRHYTMRIKEHRAWSEFPQDYRLFEIGNFNDSNGVVKSCDTPIFVAEFSDLVKGDMENVE